MPYGFIEIEHTADWAIKVWAVDMTGLFTQAALGMNWLMGLELKPEGHVEHRITLTANDYESLLVAFLNDILFELEINNIGFTDFNINISEMSLEAHLCGAQIKKLKKSIKAVTYHNLEIKNIHGRVEVTIVFDV